MLLPEQCIVFLNFPRIWLLTVDFPLNYYSVKWRSVFLTESIFNNICSFLLYNFHFIWDKCESELTTPVEDYHLQRSSSITTAHLPTWICRGYLKLELAPIIMWSSSPTALYSAARRMINFQVNKLERSSNLVWR
jgi:hypothetical protein